MGSRVFHARFVPDTRLCPIFPQENINVTSSEFVVDYHRLFPGRCSTKFSLWCYRVAAMSSLPCNGAGTWGIIWKTPRRHFPLQAFSPSVYKGRPSPSRKPPSYYQPLNPLNTPSTFQHDVSSSEHNRPQQRRQYHWLQHRQ